MCATKASFWCFLLYVLSLKGWMGGKCQYGCGDMEEMV